MALGGRALDGTETGWGRSAEPAPRWRALLDRARLASRGGGEPAEHDRRPDEPFLPPEQPFLPPGPDPLPRRGSGNGYAGRARAIEPAYGGEAGYRADPGYASEPGYPAEPAYPTPDPSYRSDSGYRGDSGYRSEPSYPAEPSYRSGYRAAPGYPAEPAYPQPEPAYPQVEPAYPPAEPVYQPSEPAYRPAEPAYQPPEPAYPAEAGYRGEAGYRSEPAYPPEPAYPVEPAYRAAPTPPAESRYALLENYRHVSDRSAESRYALLDNGYRHEAAYPSPVARAAVPAVPTPVAPPAPPPAAAPAVADRSYPARLEWRPQVAAEDDLERAASVLRRDFGTPRVLAFANPKGGVHKTTATVLAAATVGSVRGRGVLAWDDNELRGTLGLRAGSARHARTIRHLINDLATIEITQGADLIEQLDDYLRHASDGSYDVLAGEESPRFAQKLDRYTVQRVLDLLRRTHDVICVDTGNNVESANWRTVMHAADQLVLTTVPREDAAFSADWMLDLLHEVGMGELADNAVTLLSCPNPDRSPLLDDLKRHFATRTRAVAVVPYDPALETGSSIEYHQLQPETRQAWLRAASVMLEPFGR